MRIVLAAVLGSTMMLSAPALAQAPSPSGEALLACAAKVDDAERLSCYDSAVRSTSAEARRLSEVRDVESAAVRKAQAEARAVAEAEAAAAALQQRENAFGNLQASARFEQRTDSITTRIQEVFTDARRQPLFLMENGQLWRQTDGRPLAMAKPGNEVELRRSTFGGFRMTAPWIKAVTPVVRVR